MLAATRGANFTVCIPGLPNVKFMEAMFAEHCTKNDSNVEFTTSNYKVTTTPNKEWMIVVKGQHTLADMGNKRIIPNISELMRSETVKVAKLFTYEVIAIVLYTGPMVSKLH